MCPNPKQMLFGHLRLPKLVNDLFRRKSLPAHQMTSSISMIHPEYSLLGWTDIKGAGQKLQGKLTLEDFTLDEKGRVIRCPQGHAPLASRIANIRLQVLFDAEVCNGCPNKSRCMATATPTNRMPCNPYHWMGLREYSAR